MKVTAFEGVKSQIGLCGIWCGSCVMGNGALVELTRRYEKIIKDYGLEGWNAKDYNFEEFANGLTSIQAVSSCPGCREGGERDNCEMRACVSGKEIMTAVSVTSFTHVNTMRFWRGCVQVPFVRDLW